MVVLLVIMTFLVFVSVEVVRERRREGLACRERSGADATGAAWSRNIAGFQLPEPLHFHRGHTWLHWVSPTEAYVGVDDFARRLLGSPERVRVPAIGTHLQQGEAAIHFQNQHGDADLVCPAEGEIVAINPRLKSDPALLQRDPYGTGWLFKIRSTAIGQNVNNLLDGSLAERWMEDTRERFQHQLMLATGSVIQDGGTLVDDLGDRLDPELWHELVEEFLEMEPQSSSSFAGR